MLPLIMEVFALAIAIALPWAFFGVPPIVELALRAGVLVLLSLWAARILLEGKVFVRGGSVLLWLIVLVAFCGLQSLPLESLSEISPNTAALYRKFLPSVPEDLPFGIPRLESPISPGSTLSVYPAVTRFQATRLLALVSVFAVAVCNFTPEYFLKRLSIVGLVNGVALSIFGLAQYYSASQGTVYWRVQVWTSEVFLTGSRNHTPLYLTMCLGLAIGTLLWRGGVRKSERHAPKYAEFLADPVWLGILFGITMITVAVIVSQTRASFLAMLGAGLICLPIHVMHAQVRAPRIGAIVFFVVASVALLWFLEFNWLGARIWRTILKPDPVSEGRTLIWREAFSSVVQFPVWGTGLGTFGFVEALNRDVDLARNVRRTDVFVSHAYNEFLEALAEGGIIRLVLTVMIVWCVASSGYRAYRHSANTPHGGLLLGAIFAFLTAVIHSFFDRAFQLPANALITTLVAAAISLEALALEKPGAGARRVPGRAPWSMRFAWSRFPLAIAAGCALLWTGIVIVHSGSGFVRAQPFLWAARNEGVAEFHGERPADLAVQIEELEKAGHFWPANAWIHLELAEPHVTIFNQGSEALKLRDATCHAAELLAALTGPQPMVAASAVAVAASIPIREETQRGQACLVRDHLGIALQHYLLARDLCPLLAPAQVRLATYWDYLENKEPRECYLTRAKELVPADPDFWYFCGLQEITDGRKDAACESWRRCLQLGDNYYSRIMSRSRVLLSPGEILDLILPDNAQLIYEAARELFPKPEAVPEGRQYLEKSLALMSTKPGIERSARDWHMHAAASASLGQWEQACASYEIALTLESQESKWRLEYAQLLFEHGRVQDARKQAAMILRSDPYNSAAQQLIQLGPNRHGKPVK